MPTVWIVTSTDEPLVETFQTGGWDVMHTEYVPHSQPRYPDVAIYPIANATLLPTFSAFCSLKIMPVLAVMPSWDLAEQTVEAGADDVMVTPINPAEVLFRAYRLVNNPNLVRVGKLSIDLAARRLTVNGRTVHPSPVEFRVVVCLVEHIGQAVSFDQILDEVWGYNSKSGGTLEQVKTVVKRLRAKIEPDSSQPQYIISIRGFGYRLRNQAQWEDYS